MPGTQALLAVINLLVVTFVYQGVGMLGATSLGTSYELVGALDFLSDPSYTNGLPDGTKHIQAGWGQGAIRPS